MRSGLSVLAATVAFAAVAATAAPAAVVELRVDSSTAPAPLFDGTVSTLPHPVDGGDGSGPHPCAGPPGGAPAATATGALDDAMRGAGISWRGNWDPSFRDFFIERIGPWASAEPDLYWSLSVNGHFSPGGCLARVESGDSVFFHYGPLFGAPPPQPGDGPGAGAGPGDSGGSVVTSPPVARLRRVAARAASFLRRASGETGAGWGRLTLALRRGAHLSSAAAALLGERLRAQRRNGSLGGDVNATAVAVLALEPRRPHAAAQAAAWLASVQSADGGFGFRPGAAADVDTTGLAAWALARAGEWPAARRAGAFVRSTQAGDGGFPALPGGASNSQSTGLALLALRVSGIGPRRARSTTGRTALHFLLAHARRDGSIAYAAGANPTPAWTTAQALLGLTIRAKLLSSGAANSFRSAQRAAAARRAGRLLPGRSPGSRPAPRRRPGGRNGP